MRTPFRNLTIGLAVTAVLGAGATMATADDDLGLAAGDHTITLPGVGDVVLTVNEDGTLGVFTAPEGFSLLEGSLEGGDELEFVLVATADASKGVEVEFAIDDDGRLSVEGEVEDLDVDDESVDSEPSVDDESEDSDSEDSASTASEDSTEESVSEDSESAESEDSTEDDESEDAESEESVSEDSASAESEDSAEA